MAVSRLMLDNIAHIKAYWIMLGIGTAQVALSYGADDLDGTVRHELIYHDAGATTPEILSVDDIRRLIVEAGREPVERDTLYHRVERDGERWQAGRSDHGRGVNALVRGIGHWRRRPRPNPARLVRHPTNFSWTLFTPARTLRGMTAIRSTAGASRVVPDPGRPVDLATLVHGHQAGVWRYVRFLGAERTEADDLTQETFLAFARAEFVERDDRQTAGYLRTVARNQLLALRRRQHREISTVELEAADSVWAAAAGPDGSLDGYLDALRDCVEQLEGRPREAIDLHYRDGASREAIADKLDMKPDGVKTLLRRTRELLRECVERKIEPKPP